MKTPPIETIQPEKLALNICYHLLEISHDKVKKSPHRLNSTENLFYNTHLSFLTRHGFEGKPTQTVARSECGIGWWVLSKCSINKSRGHGPKKVLWFTKFRLEKFLLLTSL